jgi:hypothetical protein
MPYEVIAIGLLSADELEEIASRIRSDGEDLWWFGMGINYVFVLVEVVGVQDVLARVAVPER